MDPFQIINERTLEIVPWTKRTSDLVAGMTVRDGGVSHPPFHTLNTGFHVADDPQHVTKNRLLIANQLRFPIECWVLGEQVHGTNIKRVDSPGPGSTYTLAPLAGVDGLITKEKNVLLAAFYADCVPLFFWDPTSTWIGIAHAGWRGTVKLMAQKMVDTFKEHGADIANPHVVIGPSISKAHYQVDDMVYQEVPVKWRSVVTEYVGDQQFLLDLPYLNELILREAGVKNTHILRTNYCTYRDALFFSHRRDKQKTGRMLGYIGNRE